MTLFERRQKLENLTLGFSYVVVKDIQNKNQRYIGMIFFNKDLEFKC